MNKSFGKASMLIGHIPVLLNPAIMFAGVMALCQARLNTEKNSSFLRFLAPLVQFHFLKYELKQCLKAENGFLSNGCKT